MKTFQNSIKMLFFIFFLVFASCNQVVENFQFMDELKDTLSIRFKVDDINLNITNDKIISVSFINSNYNNKTAEEKQAIAYETGKIVLNSRVKQDKFDYGTLLFVNSNNYFICNTTRSESFDMCLDSLSKSDTISKNK